MYTLQPGTSKCWIQRHHEHCYGNILYLEMMLLNSKQILYFYEWLKIYVRVQGYVKLNSSCSVVTKMYTLYSSLPKILSFVFTNQHSKAMAQFTRSHLIFLYVYYNTSFIRYKVTSTKMEHRRRHHFQAEFFFHAHALCQLCVG